MKTFTTLVYISGLMRTILPKRSSDTAFKKKLWLLVLLTVLVHVARAQLPLLPKMSYLSIEPYKTHIDAMTKVTEGKTTTYTIMAGYIKLRINLEAKIVGGWYAQTYYHEIGYPESARKETKANDLEENVVYLSTGKELIYNIKDVKKDTLISSYIIKRPRKFPIVDFYHFENDGEHDFYTLRAGYSNVLSMAPGTLDLRDRRALSSQPLEVDYFLVNSKTKEQQRGRTKTGYVTFDLEPSTVYRLRINYADQAENTTEALLYVKPYWYQSSKTYALVAIVFVTIAFGVIIVKFKGKIRSSKKKTTHLEQSAIRLRSQLNPHFTFNALSSIQGLMNTERIEEANRYLEEFGSLLRATLVKSNEVFNNLEQELEMMRTYIRLEALRFNFKWDVKVADDIDQSAIEIPTLLLQPLIENAIKHGLSPLGEAGHLLICCETAKGTDSFVIIIKDNGTWIERETGYGLSLTDDLIKAVNDLKTNGRITLQVYKTIGTTVILTFHNWMNE